MTALCSLCQREPALPHRTIGRECYRASQRVGPEKAHRSRPQPMTWREYEEMQEAGERVRKVEL